MLMAYARAFEHPGKIRIVKWLTHALAAGRIEIRHAGGAVLAVDPDDYIGWQIVKTGQYEPASLALARRIMAEQPGLFVDVGAHFGWYSLAIAPIGGTMVVAIEPDSENCSDLRANVDRNGLRNVTICNCAVGPETALVSISRRARSNSGTAAVRPDPQAWGARPYWVAATPLQVLLEHMIRPPARPVLLKVDVEGFEWPVLAGLDFDGPFRPQNILLECEPAFVTDGALSREDIAAFLGSRGYEVRDVFGRPLSAGCPLPEANIWARDSRATGLRP